MSSVLDTQAILNMGQAKRAGRMGASALAKKAGLGKKGQGIAGKAGELAAGYVAGKARGKIRKLIGFEKGGVIVLKPAGKKRGRKSKN